MKKEKYIIIKQEEKMHFMHQQATNAGYIKRLCWCIVWCIKIGSKKGHLYCEIPLFPFTFSFGKCLRQVEVSLCNPSRKLHQTTLLARPLIS